MESRSVFCCGRRALTGRCSVIAFFAPLASVVIAGVLLSSVGWAQITGDAELLKTAAVKYRANLDKLRTWRGHVVLSLYSAAEKNPTLVQCSIEFAYDRSSSAKRWTIVREKDVEIRDGVEGQKPTVPLGRVAGMFRDGAYYEVRSVLAKEKEPRILFIQARPFTEPGWSYGTFNPMYFWTYEGADLGKYWQMMYDNVKNPEASGTIVRKGDVVTLTQNLGRGEVVGLHELDLSQGWNLTRLETMKFMGKEKIGNTVWKWRWAQIRRVWVPVEAAKEHASGGERRDAYQVALIWTENVVNEPLAKDEFSMVKLGLRRGDRVNDTRTKKEYVIEDASFPPNPRLAEPKK